MFLFYVNDPFILSMLYLRKEGDHPGRRVAKIIISLLGCSEPKMKSSRRYHNPASAEAGYEPGSGRRVLRNKLGIRSKREMDRMEISSLIEAQNRYLHIITPNTQFTTTLICEMHRDWLGKVYEWAGEYRTVEMEKAGFRWPPAYLVSTNMLAFEAGLLKECTPCRPTTLHEVAEHIAMVHSELLFIHPFRDGNGRIARWVTGLMALQAGFPTPEYHFSGPGSRYEYARYMEAVKKSYGFDHNDPSDVESLAAFFEEAILRRVE
jgi:cell filamentation protein